MPSKKQKYYAYFIPQTGAHGVTDNWSACERMVKGKVGARFKAFDYKDDAEAWLAGGAIYEPKKVIVAQARTRLAPGIYFDAGTGRGHGVEVSVTDEKGKNLLHKVLSKTDLNKFGKHLLKNDSATNNYGELLALRYALLIAKKTKTKKVFGDSRLVIDYWSKWRIKRKELPKATVLLADDVAEMREEFEKHGGVIEKISGDYNPADLGFHE